MGLLETTVEENGMSEEINHGRRRFMGAAAMAFAATSLPMFGSSLRLPVEGDLPDFHGATAWLNSDPLTRKDLRGRAVLIDICTYSCINWRRSLPYVRAWHERYKEHGLVVIGVHSPEFAFEHDVTNIKQGLAGMKVSYPITVDNDYAIWNALNNRFWPALYLADARGRIRYHKFGEGDYEQSETVLQQLLNDAGAHDLGAGLTTVNPMGPEVAADWANLRSEENYLGYERTQNFTSPRGMGTNKLRDYGAPRELKLNHWTLTGGWVAEKDAVRLNAATGSITYRFHARDLHLVMGPESPGTPIRFRIQIDGQVPGAAYGSDVDERGEGVADSPRMYHLIRQSGAITDRTFQIDFLSSGIKAYSFTFG